MIVSAALAKIKNCALHRWASVIFGWYSHHIHAVLVNKSEVFFAALPISSQCKTANQFNVISCNFPVSMKIDLISINLQEVKRIYNHHIFWFESNDYIVYFCEWLKIFCRFLFCNFPTNTRRHSASRLRVIIWLIWRSDNIRKNILQEISIQRMRSARFRYTFFSIRSSGLFSASTGAKENITTPEIIRIASNMPSGMTIHLIAASNAAIIAEE